MATTRDFPAPRSLSARSITLSALMGAERGLHPHILLRFASLFDVTDGTARVALSRMVASGEIEAHEGRYRLAGRLDERRRRQNASRRLSVSTWDGAWTQWVVRSGPRDHQERQALRAAATRLHFAELREGVWLRPANLDPRPSPDRSTMASQCDEFAARPAGDSRDLSARLWDLDGWALHANALVDELRGLAQAPADDRDQFLAGGFSVLAKVLRHLMSDPMLPEELLPRSWPAASLRAEFEAFDAQWQHVFREWARGI